MKDINLNNRALIDLESIDKQELEIEKIYDKLPDNIKAHSLRVSLYGNVLYKKALEKQIYPEDKNLSKNYLKYIKDAFRFHDIGKTLLPQRVLDENAEKNQYTNDIISKHPSHACRLFENLLINFDNLTRDRQYILYIAEEVALSHHEKWDGRGYPEGTKGIKTNIFARICSIVNEYDNLTNKEYKVHQDAINEIKSGGGIAYDPVLVEILIACENDILEIKRIFENKANNADYVEDVFSDENIDKILDGKNSRIRERMKENFDLLKEETEVRPIEFLYNRVLDIDSGYLDIVETNVVINDKVLGTLYPENYEPVAIESDRLSKINRWAITEVGTIHESWEQKFSRDIKFSVHLCCKVLTNPTTLINLISFLNRLNLDSNKIVFELQIDDLMMNDSQDISEGIGLLRKALNMKFILNGYSQAFNQLDVFLKFKFDYLKVDYNLFRDEEDENKRFILLNNTKELCKQLGIDVIVTGIETKEEIAVVNECGIGLMSGPLFGRIIRKPTQAFFKVNKAAQQG